MINFGILGYTYFLTGLAKLIPVVENGRFEVGTAWHVFVLAGGDIRPAKHVADDGSGARFQKGRGGFRTFLKSNFMYWYNCPFGSHCSKKWNSWTVLLRSLLVSRTETCSDLGLPPKILVGRCRFKLNFKNLYAHAATSKHKILGIFGVVGGHYNCVQLVKQQMWKCIVQKILSMTQRKWFWGVGCCLGKPSDFSKTHILLVHFHSALNLWNFRLWWERHHASHLLAEISSFFTR